MLRPEPISGRDPLRTVKNRSFTISKELMPKLKVELRELLNRFVEEKEVPEGSTVASLTCALFSPDLDQ